MFFGFERRRIDAAGVGINLMIGGSGPPLLLLHGYPQTHVLWHKVAPRLAERFTVVASDLRGYGDSGKPPAGDDHAGYSKRAMAADQVAVMRALGFERFFVAGHDRGGRVAHRMALDHADTVTRLAVLDIVPTYKLYATADRALATAYWHWFFLIQPFDLPERLIGADPEYYLRRLFARWGAAATAFSPAAMREYLRCFSDPATIHASCEDYRAAASVDLEHDRSDLDRKLACPLLVLWGEQGAMHRLYDVLACWRERARDVSGRALGCGHYLPEEAPGETADELIGFFPA
ncbi:MAG: alpha/beta fold hydrolase [Alphaproteobacteria bacterium]